MADNYIKIPEAMSAMAQAIKKYVDQRPYAPIIERQALPKFQDGLDSNQYQLEIKDYELNSFLVGVDILYTADFLNQNEVDGFLRLYKKNDDESWEYELSRDMYFQNTSFINAWESLPKDYQSNPSYWPSFIARRNQYVKRKYWLYDENNGLKIQEQKPSAEQEWLDAYSSIQLSGNSLLFTCPVPFSIIYEVNPAYSSSWQDQVTPAINKQNEKLSNQNTNLLNLINCLANDTLPDIARALQAYDPTDGVVNNL